MRSWVLALALLAPAIAWSASYTIPNSFTGGTAAVAEDVNANFDDAKTAIDDNDARLDAVLASDTCTSGPCSLTAGTTIGGVEIVLDSDIGSLTTDTGKTVQAFDTDLSDLADGTLTGSKVGTGIDADNITGGTVADARVASTITRDSEWDTAAEINAATTDEDFLTESGSYSINTSGFGTFVSGLSAGVIVTTVTTTTSSPAAITILGGVFICTNAAGCDVTLPGASPGMSACWRDGDGGGVVTIDAAAGDEIELDGVGVGVAEAIDSAGDKGDFICLLAVDATTWVSLGRSGTWVDGGAD